MRLPVVAALLAAISLPLAAEPMPAVNPPTGAGGTAAGPSAHTQTQGAPNIAPLPVFTPNGAYRRAYHPFRMHPRKARPSPGELSVRAANHSATQEPETYGFINAAQVYPWSDGVLYRLIAAPGSVTDIALQPGEAITSVAAGDTVRWTVGDTTSGSGDTKRVHILVKPFAAGLATNLVIATDRRTYHLELKSTGANAMAALSWTYPADELIALHRQRAEVEAAAPIAAGLAVEHLNFAYVIAGDNPAWRPVRAFDDGRQTFIEFPASIGVGEAPPLFVTGEQGDAQLVNYRMAGRFYVVDRLFGAAELRLGAKKQAVVRITRVVEHGRRRDAGRAS